MLGGKGDAEGGGCWGVRVMLGGGGGVLGGKGYDSPIECARKLNLSHFRAAHNKISTHPPNHTHTHHL